MSDIYYVECDIPPGQTLAQWRRERAAAQRPAPGWLSTRRRAAFRVLRRACGLA